jgi:hypothetical protein
MLDVGEAGRSENDVEGAFAEYLIGDVNIAAFWRTRCPAA